MSGYVVTEGDADAVVLRTILAMAGQHDVRVLDGGGKSSAKSLGTSISLSRRGPVVVVVDADTTNEASIDEQLTIFRDLQPGRLSSEECKLLLAAPTLQDELFTDARAFSSAFGLTLDQQQSREFDSDWSKLIRALVSSRSDDALVISDIGEADPRAMQSLLDSRLVRALLTYLRGAHDHVVGTGRTRKHEPASL